MSYRNKKELVSLRLPEGILHRLDSEFMVYKFLTRSRVIRDILCFVLENLSAEQWREICGCNINQRKKAWDAFWNVIHSAQ